MSRYTPDGREIPDPRPVEVPTGLRTRPTLQEEIKRYIRVEMSNRARDEGHESFEEADDFDVDDDVDGVFETQYTVNEMAPEWHDRDGDPPGSPRGSASPPGPSIRAQAPPPRGS